MDEDELYYPPEDSHEAEAHDFLWEILNRPPEENEDFPSLVGLDVPEAVVQPAPEPARADQVRMSALQRDLRALFPSIDWTEKSLRKTVNVVHTHFPRGFNTQRVELVLVPKRGVVARYLVNQNHNPNLKLQLKKTRTLWDLFEHLREKWALQHNQNIQLIFSDGVHPKTWDASDASLSVQDLLRYAEDDKSIQLMYDFVTTA